MVPLSRLARAFQDSAWKMSVNRNFLLILIGVLAVCAIGAAYLYVSGGCDPYALLLDAAA